MDTYCKSALNQIGICVQTVVEIMRNLTEDDLLRRPTPNKYSVGELLEHLATICEADWKISNEATWEEMDEYYATLSYKTIQEIERGLFQNYESLIGNYRNLSEADLQTTTTSYWGVRYTRYEWLLEIVAHMYHHSGQLHAMMVHVLGKDPQIMLFE
ncbi:hypothetical protein GCM10008967_30440 [Bacillus carboniphilus]|uniref:DinB-like domain-containing protein n=1 Tax=Bacillus carboniphilus TaxID=86663 RepID=A0ABP3G8Q5_9BACI